MCVCVCWIDIGFDVRGDVKVFDFGLCKNLDPRLKAKDGGYGYRLTGRAGSLPYSKYGWQKTNEKRYLSFTLGVIKDAHNASEMLFGLRYSGSGSCRVQNV